MANNPADYQLEFTNENGNVMVSARNKLKKRTIVNINRIAAAYDDVKVVTGDGMAIPLGVDKRTGETIWAHVAVTISTKAPEAAALPSEKLF